MRRVAEVGCEGGCRGGVSLAASPSLPGRSSGCMEGGEGLATIALDCVSTDQSDLTEAIRSNFIHDARGCKPSCSRAISPVESV